MAAKTKEDEKEVPIPTASEPAPTPSADKRMTKPEPAKMPVQFDEEFLNTMAAHAGAGLEHVTREDIALPFIAVLQKLSPAVDEEDPRYVQGAKPGMLINTLTNELWDGSKGVMIIPVYFEKKYIEWIPRNAGGGYVAEYDSKDEAERKRRADGGTEIIDTHNHYILIFGQEGWQPSILSATSKKLRASRIWNSTQGRVTILVGKEKKVAASWSRRYILTTFSEKNDKGTFYNIKIDEVKPFEDGWVDREAWEAGVEFYNQVKSGTRKADFTKSGSEEVLSTSDEPIPQDDPDEPNF